MRAPALRLLLPLLALLCAPACTADLPLPEGLACDPAHPCLEGRVCGPDGRCHPASEQPPSAPSPSTAPEPAAARVAASTAPGAHLQAGVRWRQRQEGFTSVGACPEGCGASTDARDGHALRVRTPAELAGAAGGEVRREAQLPALPVGHLRGHVIVAPEAALEGRADLLVLESRGGRALLRLSVAPGGVLGCESAAGTLAREPVSVPDTGGRLRAGGSHLLEVSFRQGAFLRLWLDGALVMDRVLPAFDDVGARPEALWLGVRTLDALATPLELVFRDWQLSEWQLSEWQLSEWQLSERGGPGLTD